MVALGCVTMSQERQVWKRLFCNTTAEEKKNLHSRHAWKCCLDSTKYRNFPRILCSTRRVCIRRLPNALAVWLLFDCKAVSILLCMLLRQLEGEALLGTVYVDHRGTSSALDQPAGLERRPYFSVHFIPNSGFAHWLCDFCSWRGCGFLMIAMMRAE